MRQYGFAAESERTARALIEASIDFPMHRPPEVFCGDGPITDAPPYALLDGTAEGAVPMVVARRQDTAAVTFAVVHEPYECPTSTTVPNVPPPLRRIAPPRTAWISWWTV